MMNIPLLPVMSQTHEIQYELPMEIPIVAVPVAEEVALPTCKVFAEQYELPLATANYAWQLSEVGCAMLAFTIYFNCLKDDEVSMDEKENCFKEWIMDSYPSLTPARILAMLKKFPSTSVEFMVHNLKVGGYL